MVFINRYFMLLVEKTVLWKYHKALELNYKLVDKYSVIKPAVFSMYQEESLFTNSQVKFKKNKEYVCIRVSLANAIRCWEIGPRTENWLTEWNREHRDRFMCECAFILNL